MRVQTCLTQVLTELCGLNDNAKQADLLKESYLYWFDIKSRYSAIAAEFGWNHSRPMHIGLCRVAAKAYDRN